MAEDDVAIDRSLSDRVRLRLAGRVVAEYIFRPDTARIESPRPYARLTTLGGLPATGFRPVDHPWHHGLSLALPCVGPDNFWGGPTYLSGRGYVDLPNHGRQIHRSFDRLTDGPVARLDQTLDWVTGHEEVVLTETRRLTARPIDSKAWALTWCSRLRNLTSQPLVIASPTVRGRPDAGYAGLFWRGPADFRGGRIVGPDGLVGQEARDSSAEWLAYLAPDQPVGVLMADATPGRPHPWFVRSQEYAGLGPAPFFHRETVVAPAAELVLAVVLCLGDHDIAARQGAAVALVAELDRAADR
ncbi:MAG: PmoA family protein [Propionibacteriaceae bacterium]|jgi:hypothetical protein|nr:PmoA family protein [Propionibacteriaceae bacterium]